MCVCDCERESGGRGGGGEDGGKAGVCSFSAVKRSSGGDAPKRVCVKSAGNQNIHCSFLFFFCIRINKNIDFSERVSSFQPISVTLKKTAKKNLKKSTHR